MFKKILKFLSKPNDIITDEDDFVFEFRSIQIEQAKNELNEPKLV